LLVTQSGEALPAVLVAAPPTPPRARLVAVGVELVLLYRLGMEVGPVRMLANAPFGTRVIVPIIRGRVEGERIRGKTLELTGDWLTISADGAIGMLDIRGTVETDDGALIYASYKGRTGLSGGSGAAPLYAAPLFETGDEILVAQPDPGGGEGQRCAGPVTDHVRRVRGALTASAAGASVWPPPARQPRPPVVSASRSETAPVNSAPGGAAILHPRAQECRGRGGIE
jgi:hypothetical protein